MAEARRAEEGVGFLGRTRRAPPHQPGVWGSAVSFPNGVRGEAPAETDFGAFPSLM